MFVLLFELLEKLYKLIFMEGGVIVLEEWVNIVVFGMTISSGFELSGHELNFQ